MRARSAGFGPVEKISMSVTARLRCRRSRSPRVPSSAIPAHGCAIRAEHAQVDPHLLIDDLHAAVDDEAGAERPRHSRDVGRSTRRPIVGARGYHHNPLRAREIRDEGVSDAETERAVTGVAAARLERHDDNHRQAARLEPRVPPHPPPDDQAEHTDQNDGSGPSERPALLDRHRPSHDEGVGADRGGFRGHSDERPEIRRISRALW